MEGVVLQVVDFQCIVLPHLLWKPDCLAKEVIGKEVRWNWWERIPGMMEELSG